MGNPGRTSCLLWLFEPSCKAWAHMRSCLGLSDSNMSQGGTRQDMWPLLSPVAPCKARKGLLVALAQGQTVPCPRHHGWRVQGQSVHRAQASCASRMTKTGVHRNGEGLADLGASQDQEGGSPSPRGAWCLRRADAMKSMHPTGQLWQWTSGLGPQPGLPSDH